MSAVASELLSAERVEQLREALPATRACTYLNAGTMGPHPEPSIRAQRAQLEAEIVQRLPGDLWQHLLELQVLSRGAAARLTGAEPGHVALMHSTHEGINTCLWGLELGAGDVVVTTDEEHPGVLSPLRVQRDRRGVIWEIVPWHDDEQALVDALVAAAERTNAAAVVVSHVSWLSGKVAPLARIAAGLGDTPLIVDGAQGAGALPVRLSDGWAAYTVSGQKWPLGPNGSGALVLADPLAWQPTCGAFFTTVDPSQPLTAAYQADGRRFEQSQEAMQPLAGFAASVTFLLDQVGVESAAAHSAALGAQARAAIERELGDRVSLLGGRNHLIAMRLAGDDAEAVALALFERGIVTRNVGPRVLRISLGFWNTPEEVDSAVAAIAQCLPD